VVQQPSALGSAVGYMGVAQWGYALVGNEGKKLKKVTAMSIENLKAIGLIVFMMAVLLSLIAVIYYVVTG
jgi:Trk-type K+ transport system membrane component